MKQTSYILIAFCLLFSSCKKDFLEENPRTFLTPANFYKTEADLQMGLNAVYRTPQDRYSNMWGAPCWFEWTTDEAYLSPANGHAFHNQPSFLRNDFNSSSDMPWNMWDYVYRHVKDINFLLEALNTVDAPDAVKKSIEAQARAWRAHLYFDGVRLFGPMPLILTPISDVAALRAMTRTPIADIYAQIVADLQVGMTTLPNTYSNAADKGRVTAGACAAMLARVYMTMAGHPLKETSNWAKANTILKEFVVDKKYGSQYELFSEYSDAFADANIPGKEAVWTVNFTRGTFGQGSQIHTDWSPIELYYDSRAGLAKGGGWSNALPTPAFLDSYDQVNDKRFKFTYWTSTADLPVEYAAINSSAGGPVVFAAPHNKKFRETSPNDLSQASGIDHYIIRYADVLLMYAETLNEANDPNAAMYVNMVRNRAGLGNLPALSQQQFRDQLLLERAWELCFEGERRFDLVRTGTYYSRVKAWNTQAAPNIVEGKHELWPVPQREIDINANLLPNNPGY
ncbi:MAG: RagB/SusD family nutrient uptake outer membrane protein [Chitinophagaceae bacterium]|nr:MAG: RagB/SusD family nutrient uptake outer membrane protein [Chitinophagaceae bacterium]